MVGSDCSADRGERKSFSSNLQHFFLLILSNNFVSYLTAEKYYFTEVIWREFPYLPLLFSNASVCLYTQILHFILHCRCSVFLSMVTVPFSSPTTLLPFALKALSSGLIKDIALVNLFSLFLYNLLLLLLFIK